MFANGCEHGGKGWVDKRQMIFIAEEVDGSLRQMEARDLGLAGHPKHAANRYTGQKRDEGMRNFLEQAEERFNQMVGLGNGSGHG